jgi:oligosaccharide repeat unit polymerase
MWRRVASPECLFLAGTILSLLPYVHWRFEGLNHSYVYTTTYIPVVIWSMGYASFWLGARVKKMVSGTNVASPVTCNVKKVELLLALFLAATFMQVVALVYVHDGIPLLDYMAGTSDVQQSNDAQYGTSVGQLALFLMTLFGLNGLLLLLIIEREKVNAPPSLLIWTTLVTELFGSCFAGKRQGMFITMSFLVFGLAIRCDNPLTALTRLANTSGRAARVVFAVAIPTGLVLMVGFLGWLRTGGAWEADGIELSRLYLEMPLINFEAQCEEVEYGPFEFNPTNFLNGFIPRRIAEDLDIDATDLRPKLEPTSPSGFFSELHWNLGLTGTIIGAFTFGFISRYFYDGARTNIFHLLVYGQITWCLISAFAFNHFFNLLFLPCPTVLFFLLSTVVAGRAGFPSPQMMPVHLRRNH